MDIKNYELIEKEDFDQLGIRAFHFVHEKTRAQIVFAKSKDLNKTYGIGFKTPPTDSKGKAHIMEHSVLNGSEKFRTKDPFMDMDSSSLQTFLNAMTYPDKTVFPVSSENDKDFKNLFSVYTDAVFAPLVLSKKEILDQEGWHFDLENDEIVGISGVVYNEMQGALSDPESLIYNDVIANLYKDSPYEYESGGNPCDIKDLTYDEFIDFYEGHYHPSNAYIYFYGNIENIEDYLGYLDKNYLSKYDFEDLDLDIKVVENTYENPIYTSYPSSEEREGEDYLTYALLAHSTIDIKESLTAAILVNTLFNMDSSKIRQKISKTLSPEYFFARNAYGNRSALIIQAQKTNKDKVDDFVEIIENGLEDAAESINEDALRSAFSLFDFAQRESLNSTSSGLNYYLSMNFDADPFSRFRLVDVLKDLESLIGTGYYEDFIKKHYLDNKTKLVHIASPSKTYMDEKQKDLDSYIKNLNQTMAEDELKKVKVDLEKLKAYQDKEDSEEEKATIPRLDIEDVKEETAKVPREVEKDKFEFVFNDLKTAGLIYADLYFDIGHLDLEELKYAQIIADLLASVDTENMKYTEIDNIIWHYMGSLGFSIQNFRTGSDTIDRTFKVSFKSLEGKTDKAASLVGEFISKSAFDNKERILELLRIRKSVFESKMYDIGHMISLNRANSHLDKAAYIQENISGLGYFDFLKKLLNLCENDFEALKDKLVEVYEKIFSNDLSINIISNKKDYLKVKESLKDKLGFLKDRPKDIELDFRPKAYKEAIKSQANVNYVSKSARLSDYGLSFDGSYQLASQILTNPYLYSLIRAKGGAYGAGMVISRSLNLATYSYRDPNIIKTIEAYDQIPEITANLEMTDREFENQKISAMGSLLRPKSPKQMGDSDYAYYRIPKAKKEDDILKEIKASKIEDIREMKDTFKKAMEEDNLVVFGNNKDIEEIKDYFDEIKEV